MAGSSPALERGAVRDHDAVVDVPDGCTGSIAKSMIKYMFLCGTYTLTSGRWCCSMFAKMTSL